MIIFRLLVTVAMLAAIINLWLIGVHVQGVSVAVVVIVDAIVTAFGIGTLVWLGRNA